MPAELQREQGNVFRVKVRGILSKEDMKRCEEQLLPEIVRTGPVRLLFTLNAFDGWDPLGNWGDLTFFARHGDLIERIAIVGDEQWRDHALMFAAAGLRKAPVEFFAANLEKEARAWLGTT